MRALLFDVDTVATPPAMTVLFPDESPALAHHVATVNLRTPLTSPADAIPAAKRELAGFTALQLELLRETAVPLDRDALAARWPDPAPSGMSMGIDRIYQEPRYPGAIHCPLCCRKLGVGNSPAIGYLMACSGCGATLSIAFPHPDVVSIAVRPLP